MAKVKYYYDSDTLSYQKIKPKKGQKLRRLLLTLVAGFIFMVIAFFVLINAISRGSSIIGKLITGQSFKEATAKESPFQNFNWQGNMQKRFGIEETEEAEFTEYEEVEDDETETKQ